VLGRASGAVYSADAGINTDRPHSPSAKLRRPFSLLAGLLRRGLRFTVERLVAVGGTGCASPPIFVPSALGRNPFRKGSLS